MKPIDLRHASGAGATIYPEFGFNCCRFEAVCDGQSVDVLWSSPEFERDGTRPSGSGIPLLFPFPGRIAGVTFRWEGKDYDLSENALAGNAIHGFVHTRPWRVVQQSETVAVGQFQASLDAPEVLDRWPADFRITAEYRLSAATLDAVYTFENPSQTPLPCGFGAHPYFRAPLGGGDVGQCIVTLPVTEQWELEDMLTTGRKLPLENAEQYASGLPFDQMQFDNVFTALVFDGDHCRASVADHASGLRMTLVFDRLFRECVVFNPPHREAVCVEPYTCAPDPFRLEQQGMDAGLMTLAPGEARVGKMSISVDRL